MVMSKKTTGFSVVMVAMVKRHVLARVREKNRIWREINWPRSSLFAKRIQHSFLFMHKIHARSNIQHFEKEIERSSDRGAQSMRIAADQKNDRHAVGYQPPDVHCYEGVDEGVHQLLLEDNSAVAGLDLCLNDFDGNVGRAISHSTRLLKLVCCIIPMDPVEELSSMFKQLAENRSIEHLTVRGFRHPEVDLFSILSPFIAHNHNLRCIEIKNSDMSMRVPSLLSTLMQPRTSRLERIDLFASRLGDVQATFLINTLIAMPGLRYLLELGLAANKIGRKGSSSLCHLLKNSESNIHLLDLQGNELDDECIINLNDALGEKSTVKVLYLGYQRHLTSRGWLAFFAFVSTPACLLETASLVHISIDDIGFTSLGNSLAINHTLKHLDIGQCSGITTTGWRGFLDCLNSPDLALEILEIYTCNINDESALLIFAALSTKTSLKKLNISCNHSITRSGWVNCFRSSLNSGLFLEDIDLSKNSIDDEGIAMLVGLLFNSGLVSSLSVHDNYAVTNLGWAALVDVLLPDSHSKLETLSLGIFEGECPIESIIDDDVMISFANALQNNENLKVLKFGGHAEISENGWDAMKSTIIDKSSIDCTYNSNHTLLDIQLGSLTFEVPSDLKMFLELNSYEKNAAARQKILLCHFPSAASSVHAFGSMEATVLPFALSWMGRENDQNEFSLVYSLVRHMSWLG